MGKGRVHARKPGMARLCPQFAKLKAEYRARLYPAGRALRPTMQDRGLLRRLLGCGRARSSPHPFEQARPHAPRQQHKRISVVALEHEQIVFAEPAFELHEAAAVPARLAFGNERRGFTAERIDVDVMTAATKPARTGERITLGMNADSAVRLDDLALNAIALPAMASTAHVGTPSGTGFACGKR